MALMAALTLNMAGCKETTETPDSANGGAATTTEQESNDFTELPPRGGDTEPVSAEAEETGTEQEAVEEVKLPVIEYTEFDAEYIREYAEGKMPAKDPITGLWGYVDSSGAWAIEPQFMEAYAFGNGLAAVSYDSNNFSFINENGEKAFEGSWESIWLANRFVNGICLVRSITNGWDDYSVIDTSGNIINTVPENAVNNNYQYFYNDVFMGEDILVDYKGNIVATCDYFDSFRGNGSYFAFYGRYETFNKEGTYIINAKGETVLTPEDLEDYDKITPKSWSVDDNTDYIIVEGATSRYALYDMSGKKLLDYKYTKMDVVADNIVKVCYGEEYQLIDFAGNVLCTLDDGFYSFDAKTCVEEFNGETYIFDPASKKCYNTSGEIVFELDSITDSSEAYFFESYVALYDDNKMEFEFFKLDENFRNPVCIGTLNVLRDKIFNGNTAHTIATAEEMCENNLFNAKGPNGEYAFARIVEVE